MAKYGTFLYGTDILYAMPVPGLVRVPWVFTDIAGVDEYEFAINPLDSSVPSIEKTITTKYTADGTPINIEGRQKPQSFEFSGTILHEAHYRKMEEWFEKSSQVSITDDLGRSLWVIITSFNPTRNYSPDYPWRHEYTCTANILNWT